MSVLSIIFVTIFLDLMGFGLIIPIQPFYVQSFDVSPAYVTLLSAVYSAMQLLASPILGKLSDRVGRKPIILISIACMVIGYLCFAQADTWWGLMMSRALSGLGAGNLGVAQAMIADVSTDENRTRNMGLIGVAFGLGFLLGPAIGGLLSQYTLTLPIYMAMGLSMINGLMVYLFMSNTKKMKAEKQNRTPDESTVKLPPIRWIAIPLVRSLLSTALIFSFAFALMEQCIGFYIEKHWVIGDQHVNFATMQLSTTDAKQAAKLTAYFLICVGFTAIWVQGFLLKHISRRYSNHTLILVGLGLVGTALLLIPQVTGEFSFAYLLVVAVIMSHGTGVHHPSRSALLSSITPNDLQGTIFGWYHSASALGRMLGPGLAGLLFEWNSSAPFYLSGITIFILTLYLISRFKHHQGILNV